MGQHTTHAQGFYAIPTLMFSQDSPKSIFYPKTGSKKGRKSVISPVLITLNQDLHLYSLFTSTMASQLLLQKRSLGLKMYKNTL